MNAQRHIGRGFLLGMLALAAACLPGVPARAQNFPTKPVTLIVPWPAGGATDRHLRVLADV